MSKKTMIGRSDQMTMESVSLVNVLSKARFLNIKRNTLITAHHELSINRPAKPLGLSPEARIVPRTMNPAGHALMPAHRRIT